MEFTGFYYNVGKTALSVLQVLKSAIAQSICGEHFLLLFSAVVKVLRKGHRLTNSWENFLEFCESRKNFASWKLCCLR